jgi:hypothetical protein
MVPGEESEEEYGFTCIKLSNFKPSFCTGQHQKLGADARSRPHRLFQGPIACFKATSPVSRPHRLFQGPIACFKAPSPVSRPFRLFQGHIACFKAPSPVSRHHRLFQGPIACFKALICRKLVCLLTELVDEPANKDK